MTRRTPLTRLLAARCLSTASLTLALLLGYGSLARAQAKEAPKPQAKPAPAAKEEKKEAPKPEAKPAPAAKEEKKDAVGEAKPATQKLKKGPLQIIVNLEGTLEPQKTAEIFLRPQEWAVLSVLKAVDHGTVVRQGDFLVALDTEKIDRTIVDLKTELALNELALRQAEHQMQATERLAPMDMQTIERAHRMTEEDWKQYLAVDKPFAEKYTDMALKMAKDALDYQEEEYRQLEKMYKADDLNEETEKIVLKRAKDTVDRARFAFEYAKSQHEEARRLGLPRMDERVRDARQRAEIDYSRAKITLPLTLGKMRIDFDKLRLARVQAEEKLNKLVADREAMTVKAPIDGVVYYGKFVRGKWAPLATSPDGIRRGTVIPPNDVFMTVVQTRPMQIRATVPESQVQNVRPGVDGIAEPAAFNNVKLKTIVQSVAAIPTSAAGFDTQLTLSGDGLTDAIVPGMSCKVRLVAYRKTDALTVPASALFTDENDPLVQYVYLADKDGKPQKRTVQPGRRNDSKVEILGGLAEGDTILLEKPKNVP